MSARRRRTKAGNLMIAASAAGAGLLLAAALGRSRKLNLHGQVVLITGGSRGLGLALAQEFAKHGCKIAICARSADELDYAASTLRRSGTEVFAYPCDVSVEAQVQELIRRVRARFDRIDILINNAGVIRVAPVEDTTIQDYETAMGVMFWGVVYPTLEVLQEMKERGNGRIVTITSIGGKVAVPHLLPYCCAKFAAVGFCEGLRAELARYGVKVVTIAPGLMRTGSYRKAEFKGNSHAEAAWFNLSSSLPLTSMSAERAARQIVDAVRAGRSEKILTTQASLLARMNGALPGFVPNLMGLANRLLPADNGNREHTMTGLEAEQASGKFMRGMMALGIQAAHRLNE